MKISGLGTPRVTDVLGIGTREHNKGNINKPKEEKEKDANTQVEPIQEKNTQLLQASTHQAVRLIEGFQDLRRIQLMEEGRKTYNNSK